MKPNQQSPTVASIGWNQMNTKPSHVRRVAATWAIVLTAAALLAGAWILGKAGGRALFAAKRGLLVSPSEPTSPW